MVERREALRFSLVDLRSRAQQEAHDLEPAVLSAIEEREEALLVGVADRGPRFDQHRDDLGVALFRSKSQGRCTTVEKGCSLLTSLMT